MALTTTAQFQTLKAAILAETDASVVEWRGNGSIGPLTAWYNELCSPATMVWRTDTPVTDILDAIAWDKYTPVDAADNTATYTNRLLAIQTKQMNLQSMLQGRQVIDCTKATLRAGLRDAVIQIPAGAFGAAVNPGGNSGATVLTACTRNCRRGEKVFVTGTATTGSTTASLMGYEGELSALDIETALFRT